MALPIAAVGVTLNFILHELMHKFFAQRYGAIAEFRMFYTGLIITVFTSLFGFLIGMPGATMIYTQGFTKRQNGIVSIVGPLTNLAVFLCFLAFATIVHPMNSNLYTAIYFIIEISVLLAFFNMLPIFPLDGSKVLSWSLPIYAVTMGIILVLMLVYAQLTIWEMIYLVLIAIVVSFVAKRLF